MIEIKHKETGALLYRTNCDTLCGADLQGAELKGANLSQLDLRGANLQGADLRDTNLQFTNFEGANLREANLRFACLNHTNLVGADLRDADFRACFLFSVEHDESTHWPAGFHPDNADQNFERDARRVDPNEMFKYRLVDPDELK